MPDSIETISYNAFSHCTSITSFNSPASLKTIGGSAFYNCTNLSEVTLGSTVKEIESDAFSGCGSLTEITLPNSLESMGSGVFEGTGITSIVIPKSLKDAYSGPFYDSNLVNAVLEEGMTEVPRYLFDGAEKLESVILPDSIETISYNSFSYCKNLKALRIPNSVTSIESNAFYQTGPEFRFLCNLDTNVAVYAIDNNIKFSELDGNPSMTRFIDRRKSNISADLSTTNNLIPISIQFGLKDEISENNISDQQLTVYCPDSMVLVSAKLNGEELTEDDYTQTDKKIRFYVNCSSGELKLQFKLISDTEVISYAQFSAYDQQSGESFTETIGIIKDEFSGISIVAPEMTSNKFVDIYGFTSPSATVKVMVNGAERTKVKSLRNGYWSAKADLGDSLTDYQAYTVAAETIGGNGNILHAEKTVVYNSLTPTLERFTMQYRDGKEYDLTDENIIPTIVYNPNYSDFRFEVKFDNNEGIDAVFVTSTRNDEVKSIEATYDPSVGAYVAVGSFDPNNSYYVPSKIGVEYREKQRSIPIDDNFISNTISNYTSLLQESNIVPNIEEETSDSVKATYDLSQYIPELAGAAMETEVKIYDHLNETNISDALSLYGDTVDFMKMITPYEGNEDYIFHTDFSDPYETLITIGKTSKTGIDLAQDLTVIKLSYLDTTDNDYFNALERSQNLSIMSKGIGTTIEAMQIEKDTIGLYKELSKMNLTSEEYHEKQRQIEQLKSDRLAFTFLTTLLPIVATGGAAGIAFGVLLGAMTSTSDLFWNYRTRNILSTQSRVRYAIDPSGAVYDKASKKPIKDAEVTAYWIPYDGTKSFFTKKPAATNYGKKWDSSEYMQSNPLLTDEDGKYKWDVPEGWWRVKTTLPNYETEWSDWLPVPPIQENVDFYMTKNDGRVKSVSLSKTNLQLKPGESTVLSATISPTNALNKKVSWTSSNTKVASVDSKGKVTAKAAGTATITVKTADGNKTATCRVTVTVPVTSVKLNKTGITLSKGKTFALTATISPANASNKKVTWTSSNTKAATVDAKGKITAKGKGSATITVTTADGKKKATCKVTVTVPVSSVKLNKTVLTLDKGKTSTLTATVSPSDASNRKVTWTSSNAKVATVDSNGKVTAKGKGTATITVKTADGNKTATCKVTVKETKPVPTKDPAACTTNGFCRYNGKDYWFENGVRQGTVNDPNGVIGDGTVRGREIFDPATKAWYWLDSAYDGAKAVGKEVWMPYIYQDEKNWKNDTKRMNDTVQAINSYSEAGGPTSDMGEQVRRSIQKGIGKWVRYDENGRMMKGWVTINTRELIALYPGQKGNTYFYDYTTGLMAKGWTTIGGQRFFFDETSGVLKQ